MGDVLFSFASGLNTSVIEALLSVEFLRKAENLYYAKDIPNQPVVVPGRTPLTASFPAGVNSGNMKGLVCLEYDSGSSSASSVLVLYANGKLYEAPLLSGGLTIGSWTTVSDLQAVPVAFTRSGPFLKAVPDGLDRWIVFTGASNERPLVRDRDGNWRYVGLKKPSPLTYPTPGTPASALLTVAPSKVVPSSNSTPASTSLGTTTYGFDNPNNAQDTNAATAATKRLNTASRVATDWAWAGATNTSGHVLYIDLYTSSLPPDTGGGGGAEDLPEPINAQYYAQVSVDGGANFTTIWSGTVPVGSQLLQYSLPNGVAYSQLRARVIGRYQSGTTPVDFGVKDVWFQLASSGGDVVVTQGTYYYGVTEYFKVTLSNGTSVTIESTLSDVIAVTTGGTTYGVKLTLPGAANFDTDGVKNVEGSKTHGRRIYRSTSTGIYPALGLIGTAALSDTSFVDTFSTAGTQLGVPSTYTVATDSDVIPAAGLPPAIKDAVLFRGALMVIPVDDDTRFEWSLPGQPEYYPLPLHDMKPPASELNDAIEALAVVGDVALILERTRVHRIRSLPMAGRPNFDLGQFEIDVLSPKQGIAGVGGASQKAFCLFENERGRALLGFVSDNGVWMTDGSLVTERGMGTVKLSRFLDWDTLVDRDQLANCRLTFDSVEQTIFFDFTDRTGIRRCITFHPAEAHWVDTGQDQSVPKMAGGQPTTITDRVVGVEPGGQIRHWALDPTRMKIYNERQGTDDDGQKLQIHLETGWVYPAGPQQNLHVYTGGLYHEHWGQGALIDLDLLFRDDTSGHIQTVAQRGLPLRGVRLTDLGFIDRAGQSLKLILRGLTSTAAPGTRRFGIGPLVLQGEPSGDSLL